MQVSFKSKYLGNVHGSIADPDFKACPFGKSRSEVFSPGQESRAGFADAFSADPDSLK